jgi:hypothetical protein
MPHLSPPTLTHSEQKAILRATACNPRDHLIYSLALGTGLRLAEILGLDVGDVYMPEGRPRNRLRIRPSLAAWRELESAAGMVSNANSSGQATFCDAVPPEPPAGGGAQHATFPGDVRELCRQAAVGQRPAGSKEGYVWLPRWIITTYTRDPTRAAGRPLPTEASGRGRCGPPSRQPHRRSRRCDR